MSPDNKFSLTAKNLGPLDNLTSDSFSFKAMDTTIFALNGSGKTFISRAFQLLQDYQQGLPIEQVDDLIRFGDTNMQFKFSFNNTASGGKKNEFSITASKGNSPKIKIDSDWKIHVFNRDFVEKHIKQDTYTCSDEISGDILIGEENIKIHELEKQLNEVISQKNTTETSLRNLIADEKENLRKIADVSRITEFKNLSYESISQHPTKEHKYDEALLNWNNIKDYNPDAQASLPPLVLPSDKVIDEIMEILKREITVSSIDETLKKYLEEHFDFLKQGTKLLNKKEEFCPFCRQSFNKEAYSLIENYKQFFDDQEAYLVSDIENSKKSLRNLEEDVRGLQNRYHSQTAEYEKQKIPFREFQGCFCPDLQACFKRLLETLRSLRSLLQQKLENKTKIDFGQAAVLNAWHDDWRGVENNILLANKLYSDLEAKKNKADEEHKAIRRQLSKELGNKIYVQQRGGFEAILKYDKQIKDFNTGINRLKANVKKSKREAVNATFIQVLFSFFKDYYTYDQKRGRLKHRAGQEINAAPYIISEGEKSTLAFCHYIALTHTLIEKKEDYDRLFFVIDDPISSMDHQYCYQTAQIIRTLKKHYFPEIKNHVHFLILTHNVEFANILFCNKISQNRLRLKTGSLTKLEKIPILPYEGHLQHLYWISIGQEDPAFYTPNCIRHVLETLWRFKYPAKKFDEFLETESFFKGKMDQIGYTLIQDLSHGRLRADIPALDEEVTGACKLVIEYIKHNYPGQMEAYCKP